MNMQHSDYIFSKLHGTLKLIIVTYFHHLVMINCSVKHSLIQPQQKPWTGT